MLVIIIIITSRCSKCVSMTITRMASRNVSFKAARMSESVLEIQDEVTTRKPEDEETGNDHDKQSALDDIGYNADLCIFNQVVLTFVFSHIVLDFFCFLLLKKVLVFLLSPVGTPK